MLTYAIDDGDKPTFHAATNQARSLIIVPNKLMAAAMWQRFYRNAVPFQTCMVTHPDHAELQLRLWDENVFRYKFGVFIVVHPIMTHGVRIECDNAIWIGDVPDEHLNDADFQDHIPNPHYAMFAQHISRGPMRALRLAYTESEL